MEVGRPLGNVLKVVLTLADLEEGEAAAIDDFGIESILVWLGKELLKKSVFPTLEAALTRLVLLAYWTTLLHDSYPVSLQVHFVAPSPTVSTPCSSNPRHLFALHIHSRPAY